MEGTDQSSTSILFCYFFKKRPIIKPYPWMVHPDNFCKINLEISRRNVENFVSLGSGLGDILVGADNCMEPEQTRGKGRTKETNGGRAASTYFSGAPFSTFVSTLF